MKLDAIEPITNDVLDKIKEHYEGKKWFRINDHISHGDERYFLLQKISEYTEEGRGIPGNKNIEYTFVWIGKGLWQFRYLNTHCVESNNWKEPLEILNNLIKDI